MALENGFCSTVEVQLGELGGLVETSESSSWLFFLLFSDLPFSCLQLITGLHELVGDISERKTTTYSSSSS